jgi:hypothetical protein
MRREFAGLAVAFAACTAFAQVAPSDPDWREVDAPPPPVLRTSNLVALDMPRSGLRFGIDPDSVTVGSDRIVRYVVVASSGTGAVNAMYEGIRCDKAEYRLYARHVPGTGWSPVASEWQPMHESAASRHTLTIARNGACIGHAPNASAAQVVRDLKASTDRRFRPETQS